METTNNKVIKKPFWLRALRGVWLLTEVAVVIFIAVVLVEIGRQTTISKYEAIGSELEPMVEKLLQELSDAKRNAEDAQEWGVQMWEDAEASKKDAEASKEEIKVLISKITQLQEQLGKLGSPAVIPTPITGDGFKPLARLNGAIDPVVMVIPSSEGMLGVTRKGNTVKLALPEWAQTQ